MSLDFTTGFRRVLIHRAYFAAILLLIIAGAAYRVYASRLKLVGDAVNLPVPLKSFPVRVGTWTGEDAPIPENILRIAGNDDYLNRLYVNETGREGANVYVAYTAQPRTMLGHRPQVCYVGGGWTCDETVKSSFTSVSGRDVPCLIHRFHRPGLSREDIVVLNFYIVNGQLTSDESVFSGLGFRTPNIGGDPARYVAQVQVSSVLENSVRRVAADLVEQILEFLPDEAGRVRATEYIDIPKEAGK